MATSLNAHHDLTRVIVSFGYDRIKGIGYKFRQPIASGVDKLADVDADVDSSEWPDGGCSNLMFRILCSYASKSGMRPLTPLHTFSRLDHLLVVAEQVQQFLVLLHINRFIRGLTGGGSRPRPFVVASVPDCALVALLETI